MEKRHSVIALVVLTTLLGCPSLRAGEERSSYLLIDKRALTLTYYDETGHSVMTFGIACGDHWGNKQTRGDRKTPEGTFHITQILNSTGIPHDFKDGKGRIRNAYGPWFFRLDVPGFHDIGIHGTHLPGSIGTRATEGCIRMRNEDILALQPYVYLGMTVIILPDK